MSDEGEIRPTVVNTTKVQANMDDDNDSWFSIARDYTWAQSAEGNFLVGLEIPGAALPSSRLTGNWVTHPFGEVRLNDYALLPESHCSELVAFIRLREASRGVAASRWGLVRNVLKAFYAIPPNLGADRIWLRDAAEAEYIEHVGAYLRGSGEVPPIAEVLQNAGVLSFPPWWASPEDSVARMRIHAESMGMETREILSQYKPLVCLS